MKLKLELGSELDINAAFDGGAVDTSVTYSVPADQQDTISVTSAGVVEGLAVGTAIVQVKDASGNLLRSIVVQVLSAADFAVQADLDSGAKELAVDFVEVPQVPAFTLVSTGTPIAYRTWDGTQPADAFDGNESTFASSYASFSFLPTASLIGKQFSTAKQIKKVRFKGLTLPQQLAIEYSTNTTLASYDGNQDIALLRGTWTTIETVTVANYEIGDGWQEVTLPAYPAAIGICIRPVNTDSVPGTTAAASSWTIDRFRMYEVEFFE
jgi:hypothetical protein